MKIFQNDLFRKTSQVLIDLGIFALAWIGAYFVRFEALPPANYVHQMSLLIVLVMAARSLSFRLFSVYAITWRYISIRDAALILKATVPLTIVLFGLRYLSSASLSIVRVPVGVIVIEFMFVLLGAAGVRMVRRLIVEDQERGMRNGRNSAKVKNILLIGAGDAGNLVLKELQRRTDLGIRVVGFVDDDPDKLKMNIQGVSVLGDTAKIPEIASRLSVQEAIITIVNASSKDLRRIVELCERAGLKVKIVPGIFEMLDDRVKITRVREINIDDLLGRSVFQLEKHLPDVSSAYKNKRILVTGAGGSIGSELCRQLAFLGPEALTLLDKDENSIYEIDMDLKGGAGNGTVVHPVIANIKNAERLELLFDKYRPQVVFHAAAHKHVPLMEHNPAEAILNNVQGTRNVVEAAVRHGVERFIFISTDKAVNPSSIMGATKKIGEIVVQEAAKHRSTRFSCVRFGNVLGSRGSVVPLFQKQIALGGPVTITHPEMRRYFMSISEAVHLIIQAGTLGERGEIFVLDMGKLIRIVDMVKTLIRLSGHQEDDIEIKLIGVRPGEKLYEEILIDAERAAVTKFEKIFIAPPAETGNGRTLAAVSDLVEAAKAGNVARIIEGLMGMGIGFHREVQ